MINSVCGIGSTGRICAELAENLESQGYEAKIAYGREDVPEAYQKYAVRIGTGLDVALHGLKSRLRDGHGLGSRRATRKFLAWAEAYHPDLLWLHNLHGYYLNYELLFAWIKRHPEMEVRWTLHDCWSFTGHCTYFTAAGCEQWKTHCSRCGQKDRYPTSWLRDDCRRNFDRKKASFTGVKSMTLLTPSHWLDGLVRESFLREYPVEVRHNRIDTTIFRPTPSDFRRRHGLEEKKIVLGVASVWDDRKGLQDFVKLSEMLDERFAIVLVGLTKRQRVRMPARIISLPRTNRPRELAEIYTAADVFVNPTHEDNYPTVNLEAEACGTRVITYRVGGSPESVPEKNVVECGDLEGLSHAVDAVANNLWDES